MTSTTVRPDQPRVLGVDNGCERVLAEIIGDVDAQAARAQLVRLLLLDVDGSGFTAVGRREAAAWAIIGQRQRIVQAARVKQRLARQRGGR